MRRVEFGEMTVLGDMPAALVAACRALEGIHAAFDAEPWITPGKSKHSCVLVALTVRDFLWKAGFADARVVPSYLLIRRRDRLGNELHSVGVGDHAALQARTGLRLPPVTRRHDGWNGHLVTVVPEANALIDATLFQARRPQWANLPGMICLPLDRFSVDNQPHDMPTLTGIAFAADDEGGGGTSLYWAEQPWNQAWRTASDARRSKRIAVIRQLAAELRRQEART